MNRQQPLALAPPAGHADWSERSLLDHATRRALCSINLAFLGRLRERERHLISKIDEALAKIDNNEFGLCENCGEEIGI